MKLDWAKASSSISFGIIALGFLALFLGWNGAANQPCVDCQIPYLISGGGMGLALIITGVGVLFVQSAKRNRAELEVQLRALNDTLERVSLASGSSAAQLVERASTEGLVVAGSSSYHRPDCRLAAGRDDAEFLTADEAEEGGLSACRICKP